VEGGPVGNNEQRLAGPGVPDAGRAVVAGAHEPAAVRAEIHGQHRAGMIALPQQLAGPGIPDADQVAWIILARRRGRFSMGPKEIMSHKTATVYRGLSLAGRQVIATPAPGITERGKSSVLADGRWIGLVGDANHGRRELRRGHVPHG